MKSFKFGQNNGRFSLEGAWTPPGWDKAPAFFSEESGEGPTGFRHWKSLGDRLCGRDDDDSSGSGNDDTIGSGGDDSSGSGSDDTISAGGDDSSGSGSDDSPDTGDDSMNAGGDDTVDSGDDSSGSGSGDDSMNAGGDDDMDDDSDDDSGDGTDDDMDHGHDDSGGDTDHGGVDGSGGTFVATAGADSITGTDGDNVFIDAGGRTQTGTDTFDGGDGEDNIYAHWGNDVLLGGDDHDHLISRSDAGEPEIAQDPSIPKYYANENITESGDTLTGGSDNDQFFFRIDINATAEIIAKHTDNAGEIDWAGVTGENDAPHDHWVESIGNDTISDYSESEGDSIVIEGHTVDFTLSYEDVNADGVDESIITLFSNQGGAGAHDGDQLGTVTVFGDMVEEGDIELDAMAHHGAFDSISDMPLV